MLAAAVVGSAMAAGAWVGGWRPSGLGARLFERMLPSDESNAELLEAIPDADRRSLDRLLREKDRGRTN